MSSFAKDVEGAEESRRGGYGRGLGRTAAVAGTHVQVKFPPGPPPPPSQRVFRKGGGTWYSPSGEGESEPGSSFVSPLLHEAFVVSRCNVPLALLTSQNAWMISDQSTSARMQIRNRNTNGEEGKMCKGESTHVSDGKTTSCTMTRSDRVASIVSLRSWIAVSETVVWCFEVFLNFRWVDRSDRNWRRAVRDLACGGGEEHTHLSHNRRVAPLVRAVGFMLIKDTND